MIEIIIYLVCVWGCAALFFLLGIYAAHRRKPMWFWSGSKVYAGEISDVPAYNRANGRMWKLYSLPFWLAGGLYLWSIMASCIVLVAASTLGIGWLIWTYRRIERRYRIEEEE